MAKVTFNLAHSESDMIVKTSKSLREIVNHIKLEINDARKYHIDELEDGEMVDTACAFYILEKYKDINQLPLTISEC